MQDTNFHTKYRPRTLEDIIGHEGAVTRLAGMLESDEVPSALLFTGPTSVGKTTLARCLAAAVNDKPIEDQIGIGAYKELNAGTERSIEDIRELIRVSKFKPQAKKRFVVIDEAQALLSNKIAAQAMLKPLEDSGTTSTIWVLCSMEPSKFASGDGKAIANRCSQFVLTPPSDEELLAYAKRIVVKEKLAFLRNTEVLNEMVRASGGEMRNVANLVQAARHYFLGLKKKPKVFDIEMIAQVLETSTSNDDKLAVQVVVNTLKGEFAAVQRALLEVSEPVMFANKTLWISQFLLNHRVTGGRHKKVWYTPSNKEALNAISKDKITLGQLAALVECFTEAKVQASTFALPSTEILSSKTFRFIKENSK